MAQPPAPRTGTFERSRVSAKQLTAERVELLQSVPNRLLREFVGRALQATDATGAAIALEHQGELICRAVAGDSVPEIGASINTRSGLTGLCVSSGTMQLCWNTELDSRVDADACRELGVRAIIVVPLLHQNQLLGFIEAFSRRPYAFGMRDLQALQDLADNFIANLQISAGSTNANPGQGSPEVHAAADPRGERNRRHLASVRKFGLYALAVIACILMGSRWPWKPLDQVTNSAKGQVTLISTVPTFPARLSLSQVVQGALIHCVDPAYPADALRQHLQGQVVLRVRIGKDGLVYGAKAIRGGPILSQAALEAVRQWRFSPFKMNDTLLEVPAQITFVFSLVK